MKQITKHDIYHQLASMDASVSVMNNIIVKAGLDSWSFKKALEDYNKHLGAAETLIKAEKED